MSYFDDIANDPDQVAFERLSAKHSTLDDHIKHRESGDRLIVSKQAYIPEQAGTKIFSKSLPGLSVLSGNTDQSSASSHVYDGGKGLYTFEELADNAKKFEKQDLGRRALTGGALGVSSLIKPATKQGGAASKSALKDAMIDSHLSDGTSIDHDLESFDAGVKTAKKAVRSPSKARDKAARFATNRQSRTAKKIARLEKQSAKAFKRGEYKKAARYLGRAQQKRASRRVKFANFLTKATSRKALIAAGGLLVALIISGLILSSLFVGLSAMISRNSSFGNLSVSELRIATFFMSNGLDATHTAAILGNIRVEVGGEVGDEFDVEQTQDGHICLAPNYSNCGRSGTAHGLFQLECDGRFEALNRYAAKTNRTWKDLSAQCEYMLFEDMPYQFEHHSNQWVEYSKILGPSYDGIAGVGYYMSFDDWKNISDIDWATESFCRIVERAGKPWMDRRKSAAQQYLAMLTQAPSTDGATSVQRAYQELGKPYVWGASGPDSYDCSGLVGYCLTGKQGGHPETTYTLYKKSQIISGAEAQPGDLVHLYFNGGQPSHVGIYIGGGKMIHAPHSGDVVKISYVPNGAVYGRYLG